MPKTGTADDNIFPDVEQPKKKAGRQEDGSYVKSDGSVLPPKNEERREPYPEPDTVKPGDTRVVQSPDGSVAFEVVKLDADGFRKAGFVERKRQKCDWRVIEVYAGDARAVYSYDELEQITRGELKK